VSFREQTWRCEVRLKLSEIEVEDRFRKVVSGIDELALSIQKFGLFHPIVVEKRAERFYLVAGYRRLEAHRLLKLEDIEVKLKEQLSEIERREIELEENIQRQELSWDEVCDAKRELDTIKRRVYGSAVFSPDEGWGIKDTAQSLKESTALVKRDIMISRALEVMPELRKCKTKAEALKMLRLEKNKFVREQLVREAEARIKPEEELVQVICGDCISVMKEMESESFDLCISDPPFGKQLDSMVRASESLVQSYKDPKERMFFLYKESIPQIARLLKLNSHFYQFFPIGEDYGWYLEELRKSFEFVDPIPLVWIKSRGGYTVDARWRYQPRYQPIFFCSKGRRQLKMGLENGNVLEIGSVTQKEHVAEAPVELFKLIIDQSSIIGERVLDPFCGSGNSLVACKEMRRRGVGIEIERDNVSLIKSRIWRGGEEG